MYDVGFKWLLLATCTLSPIHLAVTSPCCHCNMLISNLIASLCFVQIAGRDILQSVGREFSGSVEDAFKALGE